MTEPDLALRGAGPGPAPVLLRRAPPPEAGTSDPGAQGCVIIQHPATAPTLAAGFRHLQILTVAALDEEQEYRLLRRFEVDGIPAEAWSALESLAFDPDAPVPARSFAILALGTRATQHVEAVRTVARRLLGLAGTSHLEPTLRMLERTGLAGLQVELEDLRRRPGLPDWALPLLDDLLEG